MLKHLGMPIYISSGSFTDENSGARYRFLVLPRYDIDLQKVIARSKILDLKNVLVLAIQILDVLEYLHEQGYTHSDIKSSNLMLGFDGRKLNKIPLPKPTPSFQKETKEVGVLSGKHRKAKTGKSRTSNYYDDEDFIIHEKSANNSEDEDNNIRLANVKKKLRKILSDKDSRTLHRHHAFNLRQLSNYVNYEDLNSSVCSDQSYQKLLDDFGHKNLIRTSEEFIQDVKKNAKCEAEIDLDQIHKEAVLSQSSGQIYLLDYGLASKFLDSDGNHKDFGMDARKAHDGTLEYSSRDSHIGAHSRRSDLETLGYNLLDWLTGSLPWKTSEVLAEPDLVHALKKNFMSDIKSFLKTCFKTEFYPKFIEKYLEYVTSLEFKDKPDYDYCRSLFKSELLKNGWSKDLCLNFAQSSMFPTSRKLCYSKRFGKKNSPADFLARNGIKKAYERENVTSYENDLKLELLKQTLNCSNDGVRKPCTSRNFFVSDADLVARLKKSLLPHDIFGKKLSPKNLRSKQKRIKKRRGVKKHRNSIGKFGNFMGSARQFTWAEILAGNPEDIIRKERNALVNTHNDEDDEETCKYRIRKFSSSSDGSESNPQSPLLSKDYLLDMNPTYAMKEVIANLKKKLSGKSLKDSEDSTEGLEGYTPVMVKIHRMKEKREAREQAEAIKQYHLKKEAVVVVPRVTRSNKKGKKEFKKSRQETFSTSSEDEPEKKIERSRATRSKTSSDESTDEETPKVKITKKIKQKSDNERDKNIKNSIKTTKTRQKNSTENGIDKIEVTDNKVNKRSTRSKKVAGVKKDETEISVKITRSKSKSAVNVVSTKEVLPSKPVTETSKSKYYFIWFHKLIYHFKRPITKQALARRADASNYIVTRAHKNWRSQETPSVP